MNDNKERVIPPKDSMACAICLRKFNVDRIKIHETICRKSSEKSRKYFDIKKHRINGTDAEKFIKKTMTEGDDLSKSSKKRSTSVLTTNWRRKHEDFIDLVKNAKKKLQESKERKTDLPYPPFVDFSDFLQCPYCERQLNRPNSEKHIEVCAWLSCKRQSMKVDATNNSNSRVSLSQHLE